jgi:hypothetical protein
MPQQLWLPDRADVLDVLDAAEVEEEAMLAAGSNYVYLLKLRHDEAGEGYAVYKPVRGEAPLSDFPDGTLYRREYAAYLVSGPQGRALPARRRRPYLVHRSGPHLPHRRQAAHRHLGLPG